MPLVHKPAVVDSSVKKPTVKKPAGESLAERRAADELRTAIASQMSRAGTWEAQAMDPFSVDFPMISPFHHPSGQTTANSNVLKGPHFGRHETRQAVLAVTHRAVQASEQRMPLPPTVPPTAPATAPQLEPVFSSSEQASPPEPATRLSPLESPALTSELQPIEREAHEPDLARENRFEEHNGPGEIFRLDRPSYVQTRDIDQVTPLADNVLWSEELSSEILGLSGSGTHIDLETLEAERSVKSHSAAAPTKDPRAPVAADARASHIPPTTPLPNISSARPSADRSSSADRANQVRSLEHDLRRAKVRIFNPVWEVDSFQWPDICLELLQQRAEAMEMVARNLIEACQEGLQVLAVTSPQSGEGRTTVACCLAKLAGSRGLNVAIVDGDIENPTLSYQTNLDVDQDWKTAIFNQLPLEEVAVHSIEDQVTLVPLTHPIAHDEMATDDNRIEFMLQELSESFDLVIVDMGHMDSSRSLVTSLGERGVISAVVAVVDYRSSTRQQVDHCLRRIRQTGIASIGLVENFAA
jgi:Mrp family chromosome partitioning ATPase